jgi:Domain of unknown function (DUF5658)
MLRRFFATAGIIVWSGGTWAAAGAQAQDLASPLANAMPKLTFVTSVTAPAATPVAPEAAPVATNRPSLDFGSSHVATMAPFYATTAILQILDVRSTLQVVKLGGGEGNPLLQGIVAHPALFIGVKAAIAAASVYSANRLAKHNKIGAIATMVALNSVYLMVVEHNYQVARSMR